MSAGNAIQTSSSFVDLSATATFVAAPREENKTDIDQVRLAVEEMAKVRRAGQLDDIGVEAALKALSKTHGLTLATLKNQLKTISKEHDSKDEPAKPVIEITEEERELAKTLSSKTDLFREFASLFEAMGKPCQQYIPDSILMMLNARLLDHSTGHVFVGPSSSGKSALPDFGRTLLDPSEIISATSASMNALYYLGDIEHRVVSFGEIKNNTKGQDDDAVQMAARQLISENQITRMSVETQADGPPKGITLVTKGPCVFTFSTTLGPETFCPELENRCYWIYADDSPETTARVLRAISRSYTEEGKTDQKNTEQADIWRAFFKCQTSAAVLIPFAQKIEPNANFTAARRLSKLILDYVHLSAILHSGARQHKTINGVDHVIATKFDYEKAYELALRNMPRPQGSEDLSVREDMRKLQTHFKAGFDTFTVTDATRALGVSARQAARKLKALHESGRVGKQGGLNGQRGEYTLLQETSEQAKLNDVLGLIHPSILS